MNLIRRNSNGLKSVMKGCSHSAPIGHKKLSCTTPIEETIKQFGIRIGKVCQSAANLKVEDNETPLFTNKLIGLKKVERNRTTKVNLVRYSRERGQAGDSESNSDQEPSVIKRKRSDGHSGES